MEFGVGIHGEAGIRNAVPSPTSTPWWTTCSMELADNSPMAATLRHWDRATGSWQEEHTFIEPLNGGDRVIVLVNSLGGTSVSEPLRRLWSPLATLCEEAGITWVRNLIGPCLESAYLDRFFAI